MGFYAFYFQQSVTLPNKTLAKWTFRAPDIVSIYPYVSIWQVALEKAPQHSWNFVNVLNKHV